jgi:hypothetical protein
MAPEIVANAIIAALSAGAIAGGTDTAKSAIANDYQGLKSLITKKLGQDIDAAEAIDMRRPNQTPMAGNRRWLTCARFFNSPTLFRSRSLTSSVTARLFSASQRRAGSLRSPVAF